MSKSNTPPDPESSSEPASTADPAASGAGRVVDLSVLIDIKELKSVRLTLDPHRKADRFPMQEFLDIGCELADSSVPEGSRRWLPAVLVDVSESGCACMVVASDAARTLPHEVKNLQLRLRFRNGSYLALDFSIKRILASKGATAAVTGEGEIGLLMYGGTVDASAPGYPTFRDLVRFVESLMTYQGQMALRNVPVK